MTQEQALIEARKIFPKTATYITLMREHSIGYKHGWENEFYIWDHSRTGNGSIVARSTRSWEHALAIAKSGDEDCWPEDNSPVDVEDQNETLGSF